MAKKSQTILKATPGSALGTIYRRAKSIHTKRYGHWDVSRPYFIAIFREVSTKYRLRVTELAKADDFNFVHDVFGIMRHYDEQTGDLKDCFLPRFSS